MIRTWRLPDPPDDLRHVTDWEHIRWRREGDFWWGHLPQGRTVLDWGELLQRGPLTEATSDA